MGFALLGLSAYGVALAASIPASRAMRPADGWERSAGTIWNGAATRAGAVRVAWTWAPLASLARFGFVADWTASGSGTDLFGRAVVRRASLTLEDVSGQTSGALVTALAPSLPFSCQFAIDVDLRRVVIGGDDQMIRGEMRSGPGRCTPTIGNAAASETPPLIASFTPARERTIGLITPSGLRRLTLGSVTLLRNGHFRFAVTGEGGRMLPFARGLAIESDL